MCLSDWPKWFSESKVIDPSKLDQAASIVTELVETAAATGVRVDGWELLNEADNAYKKADRLPELWNLFNAIADAAREADPTAQIGGPALTWANPDWVEPFLDACGDRIDFFSWHNYAGGKPTMPNDKLMEQVKKIVGHLTYVKKELAERGLDEVETHLTEFNVQWTWKPYERRHANNVGAVFQASAIASLAAGGIDGIAMWHAKGNAYGLIDSDDAMRATGQLFALSPWLRGRIAGVTSAGALGDGMYEGLLAIPVVRDDGGRSVLLLNRSEPTIQLNPESAALSGMTHLARIDADGLLAEAAPLGDLQLPGWSATLLLDTDPGLPAGRSALPGMDAEFNW